MTTWKTWQQAVVFFLAGVIFTSIGFILASPPRGKPIILTPALPSTILVQVDGAVINPGVYTISSGSRLQDAVNSAGGLTIDARIESLNLAKRIQDGEKITIPSTLQPEPSKDNPLIDINLATLTELDQLPGIGKTRAQAIIDYRSKEGFFTSIDGLLNVPGISADVFESIRELVTVR